jgi:hypothetical protein
MRSTKVTAIAAGAAAMLALTPTGALAAGHRHLRAHKHASAVGHCRIDLFAEPHQVTGGESVEVFGLLKCTGGASPAGQPVTIYERSAESNGFQEVGSATTDANGYYSFLAPSVSTDSLFYASAAGARSGERLVHVAPEVKLKGPEETKQLLTGRRSAVIFSGTVSPADAGATVILQRENAASSEEWHVIQRGLVSSNGEYSITHRFVVPGAANIRVVVRAHRKFSLRGISNSLSYDISQKENPRLTLDSSADPISYGQPVTLSAGTRRYLCRGGEDHDERKRRILLYADASPEHLLQGELRERELGGPLRGRQIRPHGERLGHHGPVGRRDRLLGHGHTNASTRPARPPGLPRA